MKEVSQIYHNLSEQEKKEIENEREINLKKYEETEKKMQYANCTIPKRVPSEFIIFCKENKENILKSELYDKNKNFNYSAYKVYKNLSNEEKMKYKTKKENLKKMYEKQCSNFKEKGYYYQNKIFLKKKRKRVKKEKSIKKEDLESLIEPIFIDKFKPETSFSIEIDE